MSRGQLIGAAIALAAVAGLAFTGVAVTELQYASEHPFRYGPAKVIATAAGAGAVLSAAVIALCVAIARAGRSAP
jgi:hypothetical protein